MVLFEAKSIYGVEDGAVYLRAGAVALVADEIVVDIDDAQRPLQVEGLRSGDFGLFIDIFDLDGAAEVPYLVTHSYHDESIIVPAELIEQNKRSYATHELAKRLQSIEVEEIYQFGISGLVEYLNQRFPTG